MNDLVKHIKYAFLTGIIIFVVMKTISVLMGGAFVFELNLGIQFFGICSMQLVLYGANLKCVFIF